MSLWGLPDLVASMLDELVDSRQVFSIAPPNRGTLGSEARVVCVVPKESLAGDVVVLVKRRIGVIPSRARNLS